MLINHPTQSDYVMIILRGVNLILKSNGCLSHSIVILCTILITWHPRPIHGCTDSNNCLLRLICWRVDAFDVLHIKVIFLLKLCFELCCHYYYYIMMLQWLSDNIQNGDCNSDYNLIWIVFWIIFIFICRSPIILIDDFHCHCGNESLLSPNCIVYNSTPFNSAWKMCSDICAI